MQGDKSIVDAQRCSAGDVGESEKEKKGKEKNAKAKRYAKITEV